MCACNGKKRREEKKEREKRRDTCVVRGGTHNIANKVSFTQTSKSLSI
jgi:hypothetical protein